MRNRQLFHVVGGGTIDSGINGNGVREADPHAQSYARKMLARVPYTGWEDLPVRLKGDSSGHPRELQVELAHKVVTEVNQRDGAVVSLGTDTQNLTAAIIALHGNEVLRVPVVLLGSVLGPDREGSDAPGNTITAGFFAAYGDASGVFAVRPGGMIITSRFDTPAGDVDWHSRGSLEDQRAWHDLREAYFKRAVLPKPQTASPQIRDPNISFSYNRGSFSRVPNQTTKDTAKRLLYERTRIGYFAKVDLAGLVDDEFRVVFRKEQGKYKSVVDQLQTLLKYQREYNDGTLDTSDEVPVGGRGRLPSVRILGLARDKIKAFKDRPVHDTPWRVHQDMSDQVKELHDKERGQGNVIIPLAFLEYIRRHRSKPSATSDSYKLHEKWKEVLNQYLREDLRVGWVTAEKILDFWERYSEGHNGAMDFRGIATFRVSTDPAFLYEAFQRTPPRGLVLQATGAAGLRLREDFNESYGPLLTYCRKAEIPVVLTSSSRGEVTSFEYGPGRQALEDDLCFFAGTMDADLLEPRIALLNAAENRNFLEGLLSVPDGSGVARTDMRRNIYRQLLSGSHYRAIVPGEMADRTRIEQRYGIETRVDLLSGMHVKKAILASYLHEMKRKEIPVPQGIVGVLK